MKAVIVELNKDRAAVLSEDGCIVTVKNKNYEIGQVIQIKSMKMNLSRKITTFAASAAAFILLGIGTWAYASPYSYVSLDVNPSIEFTINRFDRVIHVSAVNDDGEEILREISLDDLKYKTIENAIKTTVDQISEAGYFEGEIEGGIVITTSSENTNRADELAEELQDIAVQATAKNGDEVVVDVFSVGLERVEKAKELGVTPGKLNLVEKLQEAAGENTDINIEEWLNKPVKEIMKATKDYKKASKEVNKKGPKDTAAEDTDKTDDEITALTEPDQKPNKDDDKKIREKDEKKQKEEEKALKEDKKDTDKSDKQGNEEKADKNDKKDKKDSQKDATVTGSDQNKDNPGDNKKEGATDKSDKSKKDKNKSSDAGDKSSKDDHKKNNNSNTDKKKNNHSNNNDDKNNKSNKQDLNKKYNKSGNDK